MDPTQIIRERQQAIVDAKNAAAEVARVEAHNAYQSKIKPVIEEIQAKCIDAIHRLSQRNWPDDEKYGFYWITVLHEGTYVPGWTVSPKHITPLDNGYSLVSRPYYLCYDGRIVDQCNLEVDLTLFFDEVRLARILAGVSRLVRMLD